MLNWMNQRIQRLTWVDIGILKICVFAFTLMIAKLWSPLLNLQWYCYGSLFAVTYAYMLIKMFRS